MIDLWEKQITTTLIQERKAKESEYQLLTLKWKWIITENNRLNNSIVQFFFYFLLWEIFLLILHLAYFTKHYIIKL